jgi:predicted nucleic acid-binding protein
MILAELHVQLVRTLGPRAAAEHLATLKSDPLIEEVYTNRDLESSAVSDWLFRFDDQPFTLTDAVSFAVMRKRKLREAFTFDQRYAVAGFSLVPAPSP